MKATVPTFFFRRGLVYSLAIAFNRVVPEWLFRARYFVVMRLTPEIRAENCELPLRFSWCEEDREFAAAESLSRFQRTRFECPTNAALAFANKDPVAALWVAEEFFDEKEIGVRILLNKNQRWLFGAMVNKQNRGRRIFPKLLRFTTNRLFEDNSSRQFVAINPTNRSSMAVFKKHVDATVGHVFALRFFKIAVCICVGDCKADRFVSTNCSKKPIQLSNLESVADK